MRYELYYWPEIQGRGEFIRLALEDAGADYVDVARLPGTRGNAFERILEDAADGRTPFALPVLKAGKLVIAQTANILQFLGPRLGLVPKAEAARLWAHQLQLTVADLVVDYFERLLETNPAGDRHLVGRSLSYVDLSLFQVIAGLDYAFPRTMARVRPRHPRLAALHQRVAERPRIAAYLASERRISFNEYGIFRRYPELDGK